MRFYFKNFCDFTHIYFRYILPIILILSTLFGVNGTQDSPLERFPYHAFPFRAILKTYKVNHAINIHIEGLDTLHNAFKGQGTKFDTKTTHSFSQLDQLMRATEDLYKLRNEITVTGYTSEQTIYLNNLVSSITGENPNRLA